MAPHSTAAWPDRRRCAAKLRRLVWTVSPAVTWLSVSSALMSNTAYDGFAAVRLGLRELFQLRGTCEWAVVDQ